MQRREFITLLGGAAAAPAALWPRSATAQQGERVRRIGWVNSASNTPGPTLTRFNAFKRGLADLGWVVGRTVAFEERWGNDNIARLQSDATELVGSRPDVIFVANSTSLSAVRRATGQIPIVFSAVSDPVGQGFVSSLAQPGGNITGFAGNEFAVATKNLELLKKIAPGVTRVAFMFDVADPAASGTLAALEPAAAVLGVKIEMAPVRNKEDIELALNTIMRAPNGGLYVFASPAPATHRETIVSLAAQLRLTVVYNQRFFAREGGLASYAADDADLSRRAASYADRILKGEKPADLPVQLPTKFELVLNLKTAKAIGLTLSPEVLALADEVIE